MNYCRYCHTSLMSVREFALPFSFSFLSFSLRFLALVLSLSLDVILPFFRFLQCLDFFSFHLLSFFSSSSSFLLSFLYLRRANQWSLAERAELVAVPIDETPEFPLHVYKSCTRPKSLSKKRRLSLLFLATFPSHQITDTGCPRGRSVRGRF